MFDHRLRVARERAGLSMRALAGRMDPKGTAREIGGYEAGATAPSSTGLTALGRALDVSLDFLMGVRIDSLAGLDFRKAPRTSVRDRARAEVAVLDRLDRFLAIEAVLDLEPIGDPYAGLRLGDVAAADRIDRGAARLRASWDLGARPVPSVCERLERQGVKVVLADLPERLCGMACSARRDGEPVAEAILVSSESSVERLRFVLARELARRVVRWTGESGAGAEASMERFAGAFLVPEEPLLEDVGADRDRVDRDEVVRLKEIWGVPAAAMLVRLGQTGAVRPRAVDKAFRTFARSWRKTEPEPMGGEERFGAVEKPRLFEWLVWRAVGDWMISPFRAACLLDEPLEAVERKINAAAVH